ncbi:MAG: ATP-binding protein [Syntrophorhabdaceae bacterium]|nr:ATP-binding protein [Syntrophorhabdaceae bacterium]
MFLNLIDKIKRNFSLRLTLWYTIVSLFAFIVIFTIAYYSLQSSLKKEDEKLILFRFNKYKEYYEKDGLEGVQSEIALERNGEKPNLFFVRIADKDNHTLLLSIPDQWKGVDISELGSINTNMKVQNLRPTDKSIETLYEIITFPLKDGNFIQIGKDITYRLEALNRFKQIFFAVMLPAILIGLLGGYLVTYKALLPIRDLTKTIKSIVNTGEMGARVPSGKTDDELGELVSLFNNMLVRIEQLIEGMKESLDIVAHDLRTPLTSLRVMAENALSSHQSLELCREALSDCLEESEKIIRMLNTLMDISEAKAKTLKLKKERFDISNLVQKTLEIYLFIAEEKNITINAELSEGILVFADPNRIRQVVGNLLDNSIKYTPSGGMINIKTYKETHKAVIEVNDNGIGISEQDLPKIWDRLYRGEKSTTHRGLGLGLSIVKSIVELHGGHVEVTSRPSFGSTFIVSLPFVE